MCKITARCNEKVKIEATCSRSWCKNEANFAQRPSSVVIATGSQQASQAFGDGQSSSSQHTQIIPSTTHHQQEIAVARHSDHNHRFCSDKVNKILSTVFVLDLFKNEVLPMCLMSHPRLVKKKGKITLRDLGENRFKNVCVCVQGFLE